MIRFALLIFALVVAVLAVTTVARLLVGGARIVEQASAGAFMPAAQVRA